MTFLDTEMKELGRNTQQNIHNTRSLLRAPQVCLRHLADGRSLQGGKIYTYTDGRSIHKIGKILSFIFVMKALIRRIFLGRGYAAMKTQS